MMFNSTNSVGRRKLIHQDNKGKNTNIKRVTLFCISNLFTLSSGFLLLNATVRADYIPVVINPNDGYFITLKGDNKISEPPITVGGKNYYEIGNGIVLNYDSPDVSNNGDVKCLGIVSSPTGSKGIDRSNASHRLFIQLPPIGKISGDQAYRINDNLVMTVNPTKFPGMLDGWVQNPAPSCATLKESDKDKVPAKTEPIKNFNVQFPVNFHFFVSKRIIDNELPIPAMDLGSYVRHFRRPGGGPPNVSTWPINEATAPIRLSSSTLNVRSYCTTSSSTGQVSTVKINHGVLNSLNYDSVVKEKVNYNCKFTGLTKVNFRLDYNTDDVKKGLPLYSNDSGTQKKIYTKLELTDESSPNNKGQSININIRNRATIGITSHLQGSNASGGDYSGSAWLIATYD
ncbi:hypothetical protein [Providencia sneebia]|uniref:Fimbrial adhesin n=1 Tax=Providencia sneebia DSM 19967 TaxID=1141660 RepID=K8WA91_9GAMM|nr:hypothetical protein [Providencia sneebia]EKT57578.1 fimbrial adhesin [Providencia sneebia DSM 19967]